MTDVRTDAPSGRRVIAAAVIGTTAVVLPMHLLGALAALVREDLGFDRTALGALFLLYHAGGLVCSVPGGMIAEQVGPRRALIIATSVSSIAALVIAAFARSWSELAIAMAVAGMANGLGQPAASMALATGLEHRRQGFGFGMKQSAVPGAGIIAGISLPALGLTVGWRWAFALVGAGVLVVALVTPRVPYDAVRIRRPRGFKSSDPRPPAAFGLIVAFALGAAAAMTITAFLTETALAAGYSGTVAGGIVTAGSIMGVVARLVVGVMADRWRYGPLGTVVVMLGTGAIGMMLLGFAELPAPIFFLGVAIAFFSGTGWSGLMMLAIVRMHPSRPGSAAGRAQAGATFGPLLGPFTFGVIVSTTSFRAAWAAMSVAALGAAALVALHLRRQPPTLPDVGGTDPTRLRTAID